MRLRVLASSLVFLSACGELLLPAGDGGVPTCSQASSTVVRSGTDGGKTFTPTPGLDFPSGATLCLDVGEQYTMRIEPYSLTAMNLTASEGSPSFTILRGGAPIHSATGTVDGWAYAGKDPLAVVVRNTSASQRLLVDYSFSFSGMAQSFATPRALSDGGTGDLLLDPKPSPAAAPLVPAGSFPLTLKLSLDRPLGEVLINGSCDATPALPEHHVALDLDAGLHKLTDTGQVSRDYRLRAVGEDGGTLVTGMISQLASLDLNLTRAQRVSLSANVADLRRTCDFDGGVAPGLVGAATFIVR